MENQKEMTMDELKTVVGEAVQESELSKKVTQLESEIKSLATRSVQTVAERAEKSAKFVKSLIETLNGKFDAELKTITTNSNSFGYSIPTELASAIHEKKDKIAKIRSVAFVFQMDGKFDLPVEGTGVTAYWVTTEADSDLTESNPTVTKKSMDDFYLAARVRVPYKLMNSTPISIEGYVSNLASRALRNAEETAFITGDGDGKPTGIRTASITGTAQAGANLAYDDIVNLHYSLPEQYRANGVYLASTMAIKLLMKLKDDNEMPIFDPTSGKLFGRPLLECTDIPENLGSSTNTTEIYFGDFQEYWVKDGENMFSEVRKVDGRLQVDVIVYEAVDGCVVNTDAFRKLTAVK